MLSSILRAIGNDIAIDLGTANTLIYVKGKGVVLNEPSVVAVTKEKGTPRVHSVGVEAKEMLGRTPDSVTALRPIRDGVIANFDITKAMIQYFVAKVRRQYTVIRPRMVVAVPAGLNDVERRAVKESAMQAGASEVYLIEEAVGAAIGAGFDITSPAATMVVDIGGGTTEVAVLSCSGIIYSRSTRLGGDKMDEAIIQYVRRTYHLLIGERTAERVKIDIGSAYPDRAIRAIEIRGRDLLADAPKVLEIKSEEVRAALAEPINAIVDCVKMALEGISPETSADIAENGILLVGGGSRIMHLDRLIQSATKLPVRVAEDPLTTIVNGAGFCLENPYLRSKLTIKP